MNLRLLRSLLLPVSMLLAVPAFAADLPILAKARARLGPEAALDGIKSIHYVGTLTQPDPKDATKTITSQFEMIFQKPEQQIITATGAEVTETTALDGYEGWTRVKSLKDEKNWRMTLLDAEQLRRLRANTWESLNYFRGIEKVGGRIEDLGTATKEGVTCQKVAFIHSEKIKFFRYFEIATGRLVFTETESGATLKESGEFLVAGIRFPKTLVTTTKQGNQVRTVTLNYDKVTVNEVFPAKIFAVPAITNR